MNIKTDNKWKRFRYRSEVPAKVLENEFNYQNEAEAQDGFILYRRSYYHLDSFMVISDSSPFPKGWEGYLSDSFFSGILLKISNDGESYKIATYFS